MRSFALKFFVFVFVFVFPLTLDPCPLTLLYADTIRLKSGKEIKGIIVEDYVNRIVISTPEGEQAIAKKQIEALRYDSEEDNLVKLAERALRRRDYESAYANYRRALYLNPNSKVAQDGLTLVRAALLQKDEARKAEDVQRREAFERSGVVLGPSEPGVKDSNALAKNLNESLGMTVKMEGVFPRVIAVDRGGAADVAGVRQGDMLVAVWGRLTGYMSLTDLLNTLLDSRMREVKVTVERTFDVPVNPRRHFFSGLNELIGASFEMELDGMTVSGVSDGGVAAAAGLKAGDLVTAIDGQSTRYMPLKRAVGMIKNAKDSAVGITVRRELMIWKRGA